MINGDNIQKLYDKINFRKEITFEELQQLGFSSSDISILVSAGKIELNASGSYVINDVDEIYEQGVKAIRKGDFPFAYASFYKCLELDPLHYNSLLQILVKNVKEKKYDDALEQIELIMKIDDGRYIKDTNLYLLLLSYIIDLPADYVEMTRKLTSSDVAMSSLREILDVDKYHRILEHSLSCRFSNALRQLNKLEFDNNCETAQSILIKVLLRQANERQRQNKDYIARLAVSEKYEELVQFIEEESLYHRESVVDSIAMTIANDILSISNTQVIPTPTIHFCGSLAEAIQGKNYRQALEHNEFFISRYNLPLEGNIVNILLKKIIALITKIKINYSNTLLDQAAISLISACNYMVKNDEVLAYSTIDSFLSNGGKSEYVSLVMSLIKWFLIHNDFYKLKDIYLSIIYGQFEIDLGYFIDSFYRALSIKKIKEARIYYDIIFQSNALGIPCDNVSELEEILCRSERLINSGKDVDVLTVDDTKENAKNTHEQTINVDIPNELLGYMHHAEEYGLALLSPMDIAQRNIIHEILRNIPNCPFAIYSIGENGKKRVVLRYKSLDNKYIPIGNIARASRIAAQKGDLNAALEGFREILRGCRPKSFVYAEIGILYLKMRNIPVAIDYMTVATELSKNESERYDFTDFIKELCGSAIENGHEARTFEGLKIEDFTDEKLDYYDIEHVEEIIDMILSGTPMEEVLATYSITSEQKLLVMLIVAREYYIKGKQSLGNIYLKAVENSKDKTPRVELELEKIKTNKNFYKNRRRSSRTL